MPRTRPRPAYTSPAVNRLEGKIVLVTGAARGIGAAIVRAFAGEGALVLATDIDDAAGMELAGSFPQRVAYARLDVREEADWRRVMARALDDYGSINVLVNNAGITGFEAGVAAHDPEHAALEDWRAVHRTNLDGVFLGCKHGLALMKAPRADGGRGGSIVNMSSVSGLVGGHNLAAYNASKGGVRLLTKSVALHAARAGYAVRCNSVHPSFVDTQMVRAMIEAAPDPAKARERLARQVPLGRIAEARDIVPLVLYLASDESRFVTGAEFVVDGGLTAG